MLSMMVQQHLTSDLKSVCCSPAPVLLQGGGLLLRGGQLGLAEAEVGLQGFAALRALLHLALQPCQGLPAAGQAGLQLLHILEVFKVRSLLSHLRR